MPSDRARKARAADRAKWYRIAEQVRMLTVELERTIHQTRQFESAREAERAHMAREIHDVLGQALTIIKIDIAIAQRRLRADPEIASQKLDQAASHVDRTIRDLRRVANELRPPLLDAIGLAAAIQSYTEEVAERTGIQVSFLEKSSIPALTPDQSINVFRVAQESITNVIRHSAATQAVVSLTSEPDLLELTVQDNGTGFQNFEAAKTQSLGLLGMQERAKLVKGELSIESKPGAGTNVTLRIPLPPM